MEGGRLDDASNGVLKQSDDFNLGWKTFRKTDRKRRITFAFITERHSCTNST